MDIVQLGASDLDCPGHVVGHNSADGLPLCPSAQVLGRKAAIIL